MHFLQKNTFRDWHLFIALKETVTRKSAEIDMARNLSARRGCTYTGCLQQIVADTMFIRVKVTNAKCQDKLKYVPFQNLEPLITLLLQFERRRSTHGPGRRHAALSPAMYRDIISWEFSQFYNHTNHSELMGKRKEQSGSLMLKVFGTPCIRCPFSRHSKYAPGVPIWFCQNVGSKFTQFIKCTLEIT